VLPIVIIVRKKQGESEDKLINTFKKKILFEKVIEEAKDRHFYTKPSRARYMKVRQNQRRREWERTHR
jgi:ribosomal protein S21